MHEHKTARTAEEQQSSASIALLGHYDWRMSVHNDSRGFDELPIDERGHRRAANRAEWFSQVDKPLEVHDIFGAPQIGFQRG
jgi:hypothetical protein